MKILIVILIVALVIFISLYMATKIAIKNEKKNYQFVLDRCDARITELNTVRNEEIDARVRIEQKLNVQLNITSYLKQLLMENVRRIIVENDSKKRKDEYISLLEKMNDKIKEFKNQ